MMFKIRRFINPPYSIKEVFSIIGLLVVFSSAPITINIMRNQSETGAQTTDLKKTDLQVAQKSNLRLLGLKKNYNESQSPVEKIKIEEQMVNIAKARKKFIKEFAEKNPKAVLDLTIPSKLTKDLPSSVQKELEQKVTVEGAVEILIIDNFVEKKPETNYFLRTKKGKYSLRPVGEYKVKTSGTNAKITGTKIDKTIVFDVSNKEKETSKVLPASSDTIGGQKVAVILFNFQNYVVQPFSTTSASNTVFGTVNDYYKEASYGKTSLSGDVYGWYTLPISQTCNNSTIQSQAISAADADINFQNYSRIIFVFPLNPSSVCGWAGKGTIGKWAVSTGDGTVSASLSWIVAGYFNLRVTGHELGHNYGVWHANAWECGDVSVNGNCTSAEYGDVYDIMGTSRAHFNAYHKDAFGWFDPANVQTVSSNSIVSLEPLESVSTNVQIVKVPKDKDVNGNPTSYYYLEYRQPIGFDSDLAPDGFHNVFDGILIHFAPTLYGTGDSHLIDVTPNSIGGSSDRFDSALVTSKTFVDLASGVEIRTRNKNATQATVDITVGVQTCTRANPTSSISPNEVYAQAGSTVATSVTITNNDNIECGPSSFYLAASTPTGWGSSLSSNQISINPGESTTIAYNVTSSASAPDGFYYPAITATNVTDQSYLNSIITFLYVVFTDLENPTVSITSPLQGEAVAGLITVTANATDDKGVNKVEFYVDGVLTATDTASPYSFGWNTNAVSDGSYTLSAKAYDAAGNTGTSSQVSVTVDNTLPNVSLTSPQNGSFVSGSRNILATATDTNGISKVEFYVDNVLKGTDAASPYSYSWDTTAYNDGSYAVSAKAFDTVGNTSTVSANVIVDNISPSVTVTSPSNGSVVSGDTAINATASDNTGIDKVEFFVDGVVKGEDATSPYSYSWDTTSISDGDHVLSAKAYDAAGNTATSSTINVNVDNTDPTVSMTSPANGQLVSGSTTLTATAADNNSVTKVEFYVDGVVKGEDATSPYTWDWETTSASDGVHTLMAKAYDGAGNTQTHSVEVTVDNTKPNVSITEPAGGSIVSGATVIGVSTSDTTSGIAEVEFLVDGVVKAQDAAAPYSYIWDTTIYTNGPHSLAANAWDEAGNYSVSTTVTVSVSNGVGDTQPPTKPTGLTANAVSSTQVNLTWNPSTDDVGVVGYNIIRNGTKIATSTGASFGDGLVAPNTTYTYNVSSFDAAGNTSTEFDSVQVTTPKLDDQPPSIPTGLRAKVVSSSKVNLAWDPSTDNTAVTGYRIYKGGKLIKATSNRYYSDTAVRVGNTYYYTISAADIEGNESVKSDAVKVVIPSGTPTRKLGDLNGDGRINIRDLSILLSRWGTTNQVADINDDTGVNIRDLSILLSRWGR